MDYVDELVKLAAIEKPLEQPSPSEWLAVEAEIGLRFPKDFKDLVARLGSGAFGAGLCLRNPCSRSPYTILSRDALLQYRAVMAESEKRSKIELFPTRHGLVVIAGVDRQNFLLRPNKTAKHLEQLVWWDVDLHEVRELGMSVSRFIHDLYIGEIAEDWAAELRQYFWRDGQLPLFVSM